jgi:hypothetical protein
VEKRERSHRRSCIARQQRPPLPKRESGQEGTKRGETRGGLCDRDVSAAVGKRRVLKGQNDALRWRLSRLRSGERGRRGGTPGPATRPCDPALRRAALPGSDDWLSVGCLPLPLRSVSVCCSVLIDYKFVFLDRPSVSGLNWDSRSAYMTQSRSVEEKSCDSRMNPFFQQEQQFPARLAPGNIDQFHFRFFFFCRSSKVLVACSFFF